MLPLEASAAKTTKQSQRQIDYGSASHENDTAKHGENARTGHQQIGPGEREQDEVWHRDKTFSGSKTQQVVLP
jgi:hypothetical protein